MYQSWFFGAGLYARMLFTCGVLIFFFFFLNPFSLVTVFFQKGNENFLANLWMVFILKF